MARPSREDGKDTRSDALDERLRPFPPLTPRRRPGDRGQEKHGLAESAGRDESIEPWHRI